MARSTRSLWCWGKGTIRASAALMILRQGISSLASQRANRPVYAFKQFPPVNWIGFDLYRAPEIRRNTKDDRKRASSIRSLLLMRLCCFAALTAKAVISVAGTATMFGYETTRVWGAVCAAGRESRSDSEKSGSWLVELARIRQLSAFSLSQTALCSHPYAKLAGIA